MEHIDRKSENLQFAFYVAYGLIAVVHTRFREKKQ